MKRVLAALCLLLSPRCGAEAGTIPKPDPASYNLCAGCHGLDGTGMKVGDLKLAPSLLDSAIVKGDPEWFALVVLKGITKESDAHLHATLGGALGLAFLGGLHLAWTPMTGRRFSEMAGRIAPVMIFAASHLTHWPLYVLGRAGASFRANSFPVEHLVLQVASTAGFTLLLVGLVIAAVNLGAGGRGAART